jgi:hypothetical protein
VLGFLIVIGPSGAGVGDAVVGEILGDDVVGGVTVGDTVGGTVADTRSHN